MDCHFYFNSNNAKEAWDLGSNYLKFGTGYFKEVSTEDVTILNNVLKDEIDKLTAIKKEIESTLK